MDEKIRKLVIRITVITAVGFLLLLLYQIIMIQPKLKPTEALLQSEYNSIVQFPKAKEIKVSSITRLGVVTVQGNFLTDADFQEISNYYKQELPRNGWQFDSEKKITVSGQDYGGMELRFRKGDYILKMHYVGNAPGYSLTYSVVLTWA